ncbi:HNH endonuclease, partial [Klebsiella pneumoniae]|nr:HNH endonuclease [Klebsiella pneumoniae]
MIAGLDDVALAKWLTQQKRDGNEVVLVRAGTTCKVYEKADTRGVLLCVDPEGKAKKVFKALAGQELLFVVDISTSEMAGATAVDDAWRPEKASASGIEQFL